MPRARASLPTCSAGPSPSRSDLNWAPANSRTATPADVTVGRVSRRWVARRVPILSLCCHAPASQTSVAGQTRSAETSLCCPNVALAGCFRVTCAVLRPPPLRLHPRYRTLLHHFAQDSACFAAFYAAKTLSIRGFPSAEHAEQPRNYALTPAHFPPTRTRPPHARY